MSTGNLTRDEARARAALLSDLSYSIELRLDKDPAHTSFGSTTAIEFTAASATDTFLDLIAEAVESVELNGSMLDASVVTPTRVELRGVKQGRNRVVVRSECAYQHTGVGLHRVVDPVDSEVYLYTHFEPFDAHQVFACFDQPDLKATFSVTVDAPAEWEVIANYAATDISHGAGRRTHHFGTTPLLSTYLVAVVAGPYHSVHQQHGDVAMGIYCRKSLAEHLDADEIFTITAQGLDFYADYFQIPYPFQKYDQLMVPEFNMGAMENPGCITFNEAYIFRSKVTEAARAKRANTILHEMAHMWFGDLVTMNWWDDLWLNESFATYMAHLCAADATRFSDSWVDFATAMKSWALRQDQLPSTHPIAADMPDTDSVRLNFDGITYAKGASVLRQLVAWVGDVPFRDGLRSYMKKYQWRNASLNDFLMELEAASGRDLTEWSRQWLETAGVSALRPDISEREPGVIDMLSIVQSGTDRYPTLRSHHIGIGLYDAGDAGLTLRRHVEADVVGDRSLIAELTGERLPDLLLVNDGDMTFAKVRLDPKSTQTLMSEGARISDPLARALCWGALWDMTRDGEMPTTDYISVVCQLARFESEVSTLERQILQALTAIDVYANRSHRADNRARLHATAVEEMERAEPGSDLQLAWARCVIATADAAEDLDTITGWLAQADVNGLTIDTDLRWQIVQRLAAAGRYSDPEIEAELQRDPTDIGRRRAASAHAARPTADAKQAAWHLITAEAGTPLQVIAAVIAGFSQADQDDLLAPYVAKYAEVLPDIWSERTPDEALEITEGLFPRFLVGDDVLDMADQLLANPALPAAAKRLLVEARDSAERARRARSADGSPEPASVS